MMQGTQPESEGSSPQSLLLQAQPQAQFEEEPLALLRLPGQGQVQLRDVVYLLAAVDRIHRKFQVLDTVFVLIKQGHKLPPVVRHEKNRLEEITRRADLGLGLPRLEAAEFHSPGFWEFLGSQSPLQFIRDCLRDWREDNKDRSYRNGAERARLWLQVEAERNVVLRERLELLKAAGASDEEIHHHFRKPLLRDVVTIHRACDKALISPELAVLQAPPAGDDHSDLDGPGGPNNKP